MEDESVIRPPSWLKILAILALLWNLLGLLAFVMETWVTPAIVAGLPHNSRFVYETKPLWAASAYAVCVIAGSAGSIALLIRRRWAVPLFVLSLLGVTALYLGSSVLAATSRAMTFPWLIVLICLGEIGLAIHAVRRGWLR